MAINLGGLGAFLGGNQGQGGLMPQLQAAALQRQKQQQQQDQIRSYIAALQTQGAGQAGPPPSPAQGPNLPAMAGNAPPTPGALPPSVAQSAPQIGGPPSAAMGNSAPAQTPSYSDPVSQQNKAILAILMGPGSAESKLDTVNMYTKNNDPVTKLMTQLEMTSQKIQSAQELTSQKLTAQKDVVDQRLQEMRDLQLMRNQQSGANTDKRVAATERGQDITSADKAKNSQLQYEKMNGVDLRGELSSITQELDNNPKLTADERKDLQAQWQAAKNALDSKRKVQGLPPDRAKPPTADEQVKAAAGSGTPLVTTKEEFDKLPSGATYKESDGNTYTKP